MKQLLVFIVLVSHINFSMFIAQVDERDTYDRSGRQKEDINSLVQYLAKVFHYKHRPFKDSDDDSARYFHIETQVVICEKDAVQIKSPLEYASQKIKYPPYKEQKAFSQYFEIQSPPPEV